MPVIVTALLDLIQYAPSAIAEVTNLYNAVKVDISETDQAKIDAALLNAQRADAIATAQADSALDAASHV